MDKVTLAKIRCVLKTGAHSFRHVSKAVRPLSDGMNRTTSTPRRITTGFAN